MGHVASLRAEQHLPSPYLEVTERGERRLAEGHGTTGVQIRQWCAALRLHSPTACSA